MSDFYNFFDGKMDSEKPRAYLDVNTLIPGRADFVLNNGASPVNAISQSVCNLEKLGVNLIAIPCNSAAILTSEIQHNPETNVLNIIKITESRVAENCTEKRVIVLGGKVTLGVMTYSEIIAKSMSVQIHLNELEKMKLYEIINNVKSHGFTKEVEITFKGFLDTLIMKYEPDCLLLACTELFIPSNFPKEIQIIDSRRELALECYKIIRGESSVRQS